MERKSKDDERYAHEATYITCAVLFCRRMVEVVVLDNQTKPHKIHEE